MKYLIKHIKNFIRNETSIFIVFIVCVLFSSIIINFSYGLFYNFKKEKTENVKELKDIAININPNVNVSKEQLKNYIESLPKEVLDSVDIFLISGQYETFDLSCRFVYRNGKYVVPTELRENVENDMYSGRYITDDEESNGENVAVIENHYGQGWDSSSMSVRYNNDTIVLFNKQYHIVGESNSLTSSPMIPFMSIPDDYEFNKAFMIRFSCILNRATYDILQKKATDYLPDALMFPRLNLPDPDSLSYYSNMIALSIVMSILSILNIAILYRFLLETRKYEISIYRLCGCEKKQVGLLCMSECLVLYLPVYILGVVIFHYCILPKFIPIYPYMNEVLEKTNYYRIGIIYGVSFIIVLSLSIFIGLKENIINGWKEGQK